MHFFSLKQRCCKRTKLLLEPLTITFTLNSPKKDFPLFYDFPLFLFFRQKDFALCFFISNIGFYFVTGKRPVGLFGCFFTNWTHGPLFSVLDTDRVRVITPIAHTPPPPHPTLPTNHPAATPPPTRLAALDGWSRRARSEIGRPPAST